MIDSSLTGIVLISAETDRLTAKSKSKKKSVIISAHGCVPEKSFPGSHVFLKGVSQESKLPKISSPVLTYALPGVSLSGNVYSAIKGNDQPTTSFVTQNFALNYYEHDPVNKMLEFYVEKAPNKWCDFLVLKHYTKTQYNSEGKFIVKMTLRDVIKTLVQGGYSHASYLGLFCWYTGGNKSMHAKSKTSQLTIEAQKVVKYSPVTAQLRAIFKK